MENKNKGQPVKLRQENIKNCKAILVTLQNIVKPTPFYDSQPVKFFQEKTKHYQSIIILSL